MGDWPGAVSRNHSHPRPRPRPRLLLVLVFISAREALTKTDPVSWNLLSDVILQILSWRRPRASAGVTVQKLSGNCVAVNFNTFSRLSEHDLIAVDCSGRLGPSLTVWVAHWSLFYKGDAAVWGQDTHPLLFRGRSCGGMGNVICFQKRRRKHKMLIWLKQ